ISARCLTPEVDAMGMRFAVFFLLIAACGVDDVGDFDASDAHEDPVLDADADEPAGDAPGPLDSGDPADSGDASEGGSEDIFERLCGHIPASIDEYEDCLARVLCSFFVRCDLLGTYASVEDCTANYDAYLHGSRQYFRARLAEAASAGRVVADPTSYRQCFTR